ncbi:Shedu immune nuclease family protein [Sporichthya polymorpha]|uniref:Shedu immune nuclease family protein n=1 Tax=Sporichthya polymorpha TaxID=35751 RepID=UPI00036658B9|nr:Shedu immune nuclease family protein [Sporichthya polymorpha]
MPVINFENPFESTEVDYANGRLPSRIYVSKSFIAQWGQDEGHPTRYIYRVFDEVLTPDEADWDWTTEVVSTTPGGRKQLQLQVARVEGAVRKLRIQKAPTSGDLTRLEPVLELDRAQAARLISTLRAVDLVPVEGEQGIVVDEDLLREVLADPAAVEQLYSRDRARFRAMIESDGEAEDVVALQRRRGVVALMREWLSDDDAFDEAAAAAGGPEKAWQRLLEDNPWVLGIGLGGQLFTAWDAARLEQTVVGRSITSVGKRVDALLRTAGIIRSLAFAEVKHHRTKLLAQDYRSGCWPPSADLSGGVVQAQQTVELACSSIGEYLHDVSEQGEMLPTGTFVVRPRSFLVVGSLSQLTGPSGSPVPDQVRSFELFRRNLYEPEVITFDELLARAAWHVEMASESTDEC